MTRNLLIIVAVIAIALNPLIGSGTAQAHGFSGGSFHGERFGGHGLYGGFGRGFDDGYGRGFYGGYDGFYPGYYGYGYSLYCCCCH